MNQRIISTAGIAIAFCASAVPALADTSMSNSINSDLWVGSRGEEVVALQGFLEEKDLLVIPAGVSARRVDRSDGGSTGSLDGRAQRCNVSDARAGRVDRRKRRVLGTGKSL